jgi:hypothetical protein
MSSVLIYTGNVLQRIGANVSTIRSFPDYAQWLFFPKHFRGTPMVPAEIN